MDNKRAQGSAIPPCRFCGATEYAESVGGPGICPACDCGMTDSTTLLFQIGQKNERINQLENTLALNAGNECSLNNEIEARDAEIKELEKFHTDYMNDVVAPLKSRVKEMESPWIDVNDAPKNDAKRILLRFENGEVSVGYWDEYYAEGGRGYEGGLAWIEPCSGERLDLHYDPPTHWMEFPIPHDLQHKR